MCPAWGWNLQPWVVAERLSNQLRYPARAIHIFDYVLLLEDKKVN